MAISMAIICYSCCYGYEWVLPCCCWCIIICYRLGRCVPFTPERMQFTGTTRENPCNRFYTPHVDNVYLPRGRARDDIRYLNNFAADASLVIDVLQEECRCRLGWGAYKFVNWEYISSCYCCSSTLLKAYVWLGFQNQLVFLICWDC